MSRPPVFRIFGFNKKAPATGKTAALGRPAGRNRPATATHKDKCSGGKRFRKCKSARNGCFVSGIISSRATGLSEEKARSALAYNSCEDRFGRMPATADDQSSRMLYHGSSAAADQES